MDDDSYKKIDPKKHKKYVHFLFYSYCHYILEIFNRLSDKHDLDFKVLINLITNYILNIFIICLTNNINLDITKNIIEQAVCLVLDYISISQEDEFREQNINPRFNDAINFSYQKIHDRILSIIPNKPNATVISNLPGISQSLCLSPQSLPNSFDNSISSNRTSSMKRKLPIPSGNNKTFSNYISILGCINNKTIKSIIFTAEIITRIFNLFAVNQGFEIADYYGSVFKLSDSNINTLTTANTTNTPNINNVQIKQELNSKINKTNKPNWLNIFEPIIVDILLDDTNDDDVKFSNNIFFTKLTYNLDIVECFINLLVPILLKISNSICSQMDITRGLKIANDITQIYYRLSYQNITNIGYVPNFIILVIIYNYLNKFDCDNYDLITLNNCCQLGLLLGISANTINSDCISTKYYNMITQLHTTLGNTKKIDNKNLITAIITLNSYIDE